MNRTLLSILLTILLVSCSTLKVSTDFDSSVNFSNFKSFAFSKNQIEKLKISDLDKKRILISIEKVMQEKGYVISSNPDLIISLNTESREDIYINRYDDFPYNGWYGPRMHTTYRPNTRIVGLLYIDVIDSKTNSLLWQGNGTGSLYSNKLSRDELIKNFVAKILESYPAINL